MASNNSNGILRSRKPRYLIENQIKNYFNFIAKLYTTMFNCLFTKPIYFKLNFKLNRATTLLWLDFPQLGLVKAIRVHTKKGIKILNKLETIQLKTRSSAACL